VAVEQSSREKYTNWQPALRTRDCRPVLFGDRYQSLCSHFTTTCVRICEPLATELNCDLQVVQRYLQLLSWRVEGAHSVCSVPYRHDYPSWE
jgi:hypothetical protein